VNVADIHDVSVRAGERERADPEAYPIETLRDLFACGMLTAPFPRELGGTGWSCLDSTKAIEDLAAESPSAALVAAMPLGFAGVNAETSAVVPAASRSSWAEQVTGIAADFRAAKHYAACNSGSGRRRRTRKHEDDR
jgi:alkylation response protein AidB-like acyl-CoA dehydrogenase